LVFDDVGGEILEASQQNLALRAPVVLCGGISAYNATDLASLPPIRNYMMLTVTRSDYAARFGEAVHALSELIEEKLKTATDLQHGFENIPHLTPFVRRQKHRQTTSQNNGCSVATAVGRRKISLQRLLSVLDRIRDAGHGAGNGFWTLYRQNQFWGIEHCEC
jgi:hypothetical protein